MKVINFKLINDNELLIIMNLNKFVVIAINCVNNEKIYIKSFK